MSRGRTSRMTVFEKARLFKILVDAIVMQELRSRSSRNAVRESCLRRPACRRDGIGSHPAWPARPHLGSCRLQRSREDPEKTWSIPFQFLQQRQDTYSFQPRLFEDTVECAGSEIITGFAGDSDTPRLGCVFVLPMATTRGNQIPPILLDPFDRFPNRHPQTISKNMTIINYCITHRSAAAVSRPLSVIMPTSDPRRPRASSVLHLDIDAADAAGASTTKKNALRPYDSISSGAEVVFMPVRQVVFMRSPRNWG